MTKSNVEMEGIMRVHGIVHPIFTLQCSHVSGLLLSRACAMLDMETSGGHNEFGHDPGNPVQGGGVTADRYHLMRSYVAKGYPSQGVGPCQLTSPDLQDEADRQGGCWNLVPNMMVGFKFLQGLIDLHGEQGGFTAYNGAGPAAVAYGERAVNLANVWHDRLS